MLDLRTVEKAVGRLLLDCEGLGDTAVSGKATVDNEEADLEKTLVSSGKNWLVDFNMVTQTKQG